MNKKKLLALLMALVMTLSLIPTTVWADDTPSSEPAGSIQGYDAEGVTLIGTYATLKEAIATEGVYYVKLTGAISESGINLNTKDLTLDLNGKAVNATNANDLFMSVGGGHTLTIKDSAGGGVIQSTANDGGLFCSFGSEATVVLESGKIELNTDDTSNVVFGGVDGSIAAMITGGIVETDGAVADGAGCTISISGGQIEGAGFEGFFSQMLNSHPAISITGGSFKGMTVDTTANTIGGKAVHEGYKVVEDTDLGEGWYKVVPDVVNVAKIGDDKYETLDAALTAANSGDTIKLLADIDATSYTYTDNRIPISKSLTIDGQNHIITVANRGFGVGMNATSNIDVTFKDVTIKNSASSGRCIDTRGNIDTLTLDHVTLSTDGASNGYTQPLTIGGNQSTAATININNSTIQTNVDATAYYAIITFNPVHMNITNSTIKGWACIYAKGPDGSAGSAGSVFTITDSTLECYNKYSGSSNAFSMFASEDNNVTFDVSKSELVVVVTGDQEQAIAGTDYTTEGRTDVNVSLGEDNKVTFDGNNATFAYNSANLSISGGLFNEYVPKFFCAEGYICVANPDTETNTDYPYMVTEGTLVAEVLRPDEENPGFYRYVGGYATLQAAIDAVPADGTETIISMIGDETILGNAGVTIPTTKNVVLDLDGHTIKNAVNEDIASQVITNRGTLTIMDSTGTGLITNAVQEGTNPGEWWSTPQYNYVTNVITNSGTLTVESGTIRQTAAGSICYAVDNNSTSYDTILNVKGGLITDVRGTVVRMFCNSTTHKNVINITGGEITTPGKAAIWTQLPGSNANSMKQAELNISGGSVSGGTYAWYDYSYGDGWNNVNYSFTGGQLKGLVATAKAEGAYQFISGGIYSVKPDAKYICDGYAAMANEDEETKKDYPYKVDKMTVVESSTVTVNQDSNLVTSDTNNQTAIDAYTSAVSAASVTTDNAVTVSGVVLTMDETVNNNTTTGVQAVVDAARTKAAEENKTEFTESLDSASTVKIDVNVKVTPKEYDTEVKNVLTFDLTPYAKVTVTKDDETSVSVDGVEVTNEMIDQDQPIYVKLYTGEEPKILLHICDKTTESLTKGSEATLNTFKYADGYCEFYVSHFSDIKAILPNSSEGGFLEIDGGSLRRRVLTDNRDSVINYATDLRLRFKINLPQGAEIVTGADKSYFDWGLDESMSYRATLTSTSEEYAALIINRVKAAQFNTEIYCQLHLTYELEGQEYTMVCGPMHRSVNYIATALADTENATGDITQAWINYGRFLLGRQGYGTYNLSDN